MVGMKAVDLLGVQLVAGSGALVVLLQEHDEPHRVLPLFVGGPEASAIALGAAGATAQRPLTHDVMADLVQQLGAQLERVEVTALEDSTFYADLVVVGPTGDLRVDARPSDAIALALRAHAPLFVSDAIMDEAGAPLDEDDLEDGPDDVIDVEAIEAEVDEFRDFLADLDPDDFGTATD
jgi:bifunctional DNase/RNase